MSIFRITPVARPQRSKRLAASVRSRKATNADGTTLVVRRRIQCSRGNWEKRIGRPQSLANVPGACRSPRLRHHA